MASAGFVGDGAGVAGDGGAGGAVAAVGVGEEVGEMLPGLYGMVWYRRRSSVVGAVVVVWVLLLKVLVLFDSMFCVGLQRFC